MTTVDDEKAMMMITRRKVDGISIGNRLIVAIGERGRLKISPIALSREVFCCFVVCYSKV